MVERLVMSKKTSISPWWFWIIFKNWEQEIKYYNRSYSHGSIAQKIPRVLGTVSQEPWRKTNYIFLSLIIWMITIFISHNSVPAASHWISWCHSITRKYLMCCQVWKEKIWEVFEMVWLGFWAYSRETPLLCIFYLAVLWNILFDKRVLQLKSTCHRQNVCVLPNSCVEIRV